MPPRRLPPTATTTDARSPAPPERRRSPTSELVVVEATDAPVVDTGEITAHAAGAGRRDRRDAAGRRAGAPGFRLRPLLLLAVLAAGGDRRRRADARSSRSTRRSTAARPGYMVNDFGTNNTVAALLAAGAMVVGALVWCAGHHWGAGLAGGAGASLAGWVALVLGVAEWRLADGDAAGSAVSRSPGYWILGGAGALGVLVLLGSIARSGRRRPSRARSVDRRARPRSRSSSPPADR